MHVAAFHSDAICYTPFILLSLPKQIHCTIATCSYNASCMRLLTTAQGTLRMHIPSTIPTVLHVVLYIPTSVNYHPLG